MAADPRASANRLSAALVPLFGISWSRRAISNITTEPINKLLLRLRNAALPKPDRHRSAELVELAFFAPTPSSRNGGGWKVLADRYRIARRHTWTALADAVAMFLSDGVSTPMPDIDGSCIP